MMSRAKIFSVVLGLFSLSLFSQNDDITFRAFRVEVSPLRMAAGIYDLNIEYKYSNDYAALIYGGYQISMPYIENYNDDAFEGIVAGVGMKRFRGNSATKFGYFSAELFFKSLSYDLKCITSEFQVVGTESYFQSAEKTVIGLKIMTGFEKMLGPTFIYDASVGVGLRGSFGKKTSSGFFKGDCSNIPTDLEYTNRPISVFYPMLYLDLKFGARFHTKKQMVDFKYSK